MNTNDKSLPIVVGIKDAAIITGLSVHELRTGCKSGKYPFVRSGYGGKTSKYLFHIEALEQAIANSAQGNQYNDFNDANVFQLSNLRKVAP